MFTEKLKQTYPEGVHISSADMDAAGLCTLIEYPAERVLRGTFTLTERNDALHPEELQTELRMEPQNFHLVGPSTDFFLEPLDGMPDDEDRENEETVLNRFLDRYPDFTGGQADVDLHDTLKLFECLHVENIPMSKVTQLLLLHPDMETKELKEVLQLFDLMQRGITVLESGKTLMPDVDRRVREVTESLQHIYTGKDKPLEEHQYYRNDVRPVYDRELKEMAQLKLRERRMIQTRPQSFNITWSNANGDGWECRKMTDIINKRFLDYRGMLVRAEQSAAGPDSPDMRLDIFTTEPQWRKEILDVVQKSWALRQMDEITEREELPREIAAWHVQNDVQKLMHMRFAGVRDILYVFETGTDGLVLVDRDRKVKRFGEEFSPANRAALDRIVTHENIRTVDGSLYMCPVGPERVFLEKSKGRAIHVRQETVDGNTVLVQPYKLNPSRVQDFPDEYVDITGRVTDIQIIGEGHASAVRCRIDGQRQPAARISYPDAQGFRNGAVTAEQLAVKYFAWELMQDKEYNVQQNKGIKY